MFHLAQVNITVEQRLSELRNSMESKFAGSPDELEGARKALSAQVHCVMVWGGGRVRGGGH